MAEIGITTPEFMDKLELASYRGGVPELLKVAADEWEKQRNHFLTVINLLQTTMAHGSANITPPEINRIDDSDNPFAAQLESGDMIAVSSDTACIVSAQIWIQHGQPGEAFKIEFPNDIYPRPYGTAIQEIPNALLTLFRREATIDDITTKLFDSVIEKAELLDIMRRLGFAYYFQPTAIYEQRRLEEFDRIWPRLKQIGKYRQPTGGNRKRALNDFKRIVRTTFDNVDKRRSD